MAYEIVNKFIPSSLYALKAPYSMKPEYVTIHNTYNDASAANEIAYMTRNTAATSYHVAIDDKQAVQAIPFSRNAWHCGDGQGAGNRKSIGIEICYSKSGGQRYYDAEANAVIYTAHVLKQYGWGVEKIRWHRDWSGKICPHRMIAEGRLDPFKARVKAALDGLNGKPAPPVVVDTPKKEVARMFKPSSPTLTDAYANFLQDAIKGGRLTEKWLADYKAGKLSLDDALALFVIDSQRK